MAFTGCSKSGTNEQERRWVLELEDDGTVIYSRKPSFEEDSLLGLNFFDDVIGFDDMTKYRQNFHSFVKSNKAAASFVWRRSSACEGADTKVLMTRAYQTGSCPPTGVVMIEIRGY